MEVYADQEMEVQEISSSKVQSLLKEPISQLIAREKKYQIELEVEREKARDQKKEESEEEEMSEMVNDGKLWVDKYTSQKFFDLLTDEITNRKVMTWLKSWDDIVFPDRPKVSLKPPEFAKGGKAQQSFF